jgi:hypothetical protein
VIQKALLGAFEGGLRGGFCLCVHRRGIRQTVLEARPRAPLLRGGLVASLALAAHRVLHGVTLVEDDHSVEI